MIYAVIDTNVLVAAVPPRFRATLTMQNKKRHLYEMPLIFAPVLHNSSLPKGGLHPGGDFCTTVYQPRKLRLNRPMQR